MASGYLYALANESMPGVFKVGCTSRNPFERAKELRTTGVPTPFFVVAAVSVPEIKKAEAGAHTLLGTKGKRVDGDREFFRTTLLDIIQVFAQLVSEWSGSSIHQGAALTHEQVLADAKIYHHGHQETPPDLKKALKLYEQASQLGSVEAADVLSRLYRTGNGVRKSPEKAAYYKNKVEEIKKKAEEIQVKEEEDKEIRWKTFVDESDQTLRKHLEKNDYYSAWVESASTANVKSMELILPRLNLNDQIDPFLNLTAVAYHFIPDGEKATAAREWLAQNMEPRVSLKTAEEALLYAIEDIRKAFESKTMANVPKDLVARKEISVFREMISIIIRQDPNKEVSSLIDSLLELEADDFIRMPKYIDYIDLGMTRSAINLIVIGLITGKWS